MREAGFTDESGKPVTQHPTGPAMLALPPIVAMINATLRQVAPSGETVRTTLLATRRILSHIDVTTLAYTLGGKSSYGQLVDRIDALLGQPVTSADEVCGLLRDIRASLGFAVNNEDTHG